MQAIEWHAINIPYAPESVEVRIESVDYAATFGGRHWKGVSFNWSNAPSDSKVEGQLQKKDPPTAATMNSPVAATISVSFGSIEKQLAKFAQAMGSRLVYFERRGQLGVSVSLLRNRRILRLTYELPKSSDKLLNSSENLSTNVDTQLLKALLNELLQYHWGR